MTKNTILRFLLILIPLTATSQNKMVTKLSEQLCKCLEKNEITKMTDADPCYEQMILKNVEKLYDFYKVESMDDLDFNKIGAEIGVHLVKNCDYLKNLVDDSYKLDEDALPDANLDCEKMRHGDYYYVLADLTTNINDTTYVTIKDNMYLERINNGKNYALLDIQWGDDCQFELIYKNSNDVYKNALSKEGAKYEYQVMSSTSNSFIIKSIINEVAYKFELFKME